MTTPLAPLQIGPEPFDGPAVQGLLAELPWGVGDLTAPEFTPPQGTMLVAYLTDGDAVGCCGVRRLTEGVGEIKRLFVRERAAAVASPARCLPPPRTPPAGSATASCGSTPTPMSQRHCSRRQDGTRLPPTTTTTTRATGSHVP